MTARNYEMCTTRVDSVRHALCLGRYAFWGGQKRWQTSGLMMDWINDCRYCGVNEVPLSDHRYWIDHSIEIDTKRRVSDGASPSRVGRTASAPGCLTILCRKTSCGRKSLTLFVIGCDLLWDHQCRNGTFKQLAARYCPQNTVRNRQVAQPQL